LYILSTKSVKEAAYMSGFTNLILFIQVFIDWRCSDSMMTVAPQLINNPALNGGDLEILYQQ
jgi:hypothetical protein